MPRRRERFDVVFYLPWIGPLYARDRATPPGGAETQIYLLARELAARGLRVGVFAFEIPGLPREVDGVRVLTRRPYAAGQRRLVGKFVEAVAVWRALASVRADAYVQRAAGIQTGLVGIWARAVGARFVYSSAATSDFTWDHMAAKRRDLALYLLGIRLTSEIVVQTEEQVALCRRQFRREPHLIRSLAETACVQSALPEAFLWIGRLVSYKHPLEFLDLAEAMPEARFRMVGVPVPSTEADEAMVAEIERRAAALDNFELVEPRARPELMGLVERAVAVVNTSSIEGMPNVFLEAWARGVPALSLRADPDGIIGRERLGACAADNMDRMVEQARALWASRADRRDLAERCIDYVAREHAPSAVAAKWADVIARDR